MMENEVVGSYQPMLVALSYLVAVAASFGALHLTSRLHELRQDARRIGLVVAAIALGFGIWGTHVLGMIAYRLPFPADYDVPLALLLAITGSGMAPRLTFSDRLNVQPIAKQ